MFLASCRPHDLRPFRTIPATVFPSQLLELSPVRTAQSGQGVERIPPRVRSSTLWGQLGMCAVALASHTVLDDSPRKDFSNMPEPYSNEYRQQRQLHDSMTALFHIGAVSVGS